MISKHVDFARNSSEGSGSPDEIVEGHIAVKNVRCGIPRMISAERLHRQNSEDPLCTTTRIAHRTALHPNQMTGLLYVTELPNWSKFFGPFSPSDMHLSKLFRWQKRT
jgi:hypothetical protein